MTSARRTDGVMCKGGSRVREYTMTTIVEILPSAEKSLFVLVLEIEADNTIELRGSPVPVLLGEEFVAALIDPFAHHWRADLPLQPSE
jgi:hypothetical protein